MTVQGGRVRVLHVVSSTDRRGAESAAVQLSAALEGLGLPGSVVALARGSSGGLSIPVIGPSRFSRQTLRSLRAAAEEADVVVAHGSSSLPAVAASAGSCPFVYRSIGDPRAWVNSAARRARVRIAVSRASGVVALWRSSAVFWHENLHVRPELIEVIPNGVDPSAFPLATAADRAAARDSLGLPVGSPVILCLGSLSPEKRVDLAIRALESEADWHLAVVGDGPQRRALESLASERLGHRAVFTGRTDDPWRALCASDVVMIPSDTEGQPAVAIEAGLTGRPVVATRVGGLTEIIRDGRTGFLVEAGDAKDLNEAVRKSLSGSDVLGAAAAAHCQAEFDLGSVARRWMRFLQRVIT